MLEQRQYPATQNDNARYYLGRAVIAVASAGYIVRIMDEDTFIAIHPSSLSYSLGDITMYPPPKYEPQYQRSPLRLRLARDAFWWRPIAEIVITREEKP